MCDVDGNLLFYTDGETVYNKSHLIMTNGTGLLGSKGSTQSATIVPWPENDSLYYIFTTDDYFNFGNKGYNYAVVDMKKNNGLGEVVVKNQLLYKQSTEKLTVARHCNGKDWWVITKKWGTNQFYCYRVDKNGINTTPVISVAGDIPTNNWARGYMKVSPDNTLLAAMHDANFGDSYLEIFNFDNSTGLVSHAIKLEDPAVNSSVYGIEFSPNSRLLYTGDLQSLQVHQFDLTKLNATDIAASRLTITPATYAKEPCAMQLGPDGKIYIIAVKMDFASDYLDVIHSPNQRGNGCNFQENVIYLNNGKPNFIGLPNIVSNLLIAPSVQQPPPFTIHIRSTLIDPCKRIVLFEAESDAKDNIHYKWYWGDGDSSDAQHFTKTYGFAKDTYDVKLKVTADVTSCGEPITLTRESSQEIVFEKLPIAFAGNDTLVANGQPLKLQASGGIKYEWTPATFLSNAFIADPIAVLGKDQRYTVKVSSASNCDAYASIFVKVYTGPDIYVPNAFTPNNDGKNDLLKVVPAGLQLQNFAIYNRWGQLVFSTTNYKQGWNGLYRGNIQPHGTYTWIAKGLSYKGETITRRGTLTLIR